MAIIGTGIDSVEIYRIQEIIEKFGERFIQRVFTANESKKCLSRSDSASCFAARFAVKEAFFKAVPHEHKKGFELRSVETINMHDGKPEIRLHDSMKSFIEGIDNVKIHVSLTHSRITAAAVVIIEEI